MDNLVGSKKALNSAKQEPYKTKPTLKRIKDGKKIAMKKKINIGSPILAQIYAFYLKTCLFIRRTCLLPSQRTTYRIFPV